MTPALSEASVIVTTYNSPHALNLVLRGYLCQQFRGFEIVVADDGSKPETTDLIRRFKRETSIPILHVWQEDDGFQKCRILNKAIVAARADYLIFVDGDCIPRNDFVATHIAQRSAAHFLAGAMFRLSAKVTERVTEQDVTSQNVFKPAWLLRQGQPYSPKQNWKLTKNRLWAGLAESLSNAYPSWNGANSSCFRKDALRVNGFNEKMVYGAEDMEFGVRLRNAGLACRKVRYAAACVHLEHKRGYETQAGWEHNRAILHDTASRQLVRTPYGLESYLGRAAEFLVD